MNVLNPATPAPKETPTGTPPAPTALPEPTGQTKAIIDLITQLLERIKSNPSQAQSLGDLPKRMEILFVKLRSSDIPDAALSTLLNFAQGLHNRDDKTTNQLFLVLTKDYSSLFGSQCVVGLKNLRRLTLQ
jgi:hypothetical protein